jgi:trimethylguanosine synthase
MTSPVPTLRERLSAAVPRFPLKTAWPVAIRSSRAWGRRTGASPRLGGRTDVDRLLVLTAPATDDAAQLKAALAAVLNAPDADEPAEALNELVVRLLPRLSRGLVPLTISGLPPGFTHHNLRRLAGLENSSLLVDSLEAKIVHKRLDGMVLGGSRIRVEIDLPRDRVLPAMPRHLRSEGSPRRRADPWLQHLDDEGRWSLTPLPIARRHAREAMGHLVVDVGCGCGGNVVAFAEAGFDVVAIEADAARLELAKANVRSWAPTGTVRFIHGKAADVLPAVLEEEPSAAVFIDPPWGGCDWPRQAMTWDELIQPLGVSTDLLRSGTQLLVKAPRTFDVTTLPMPETWNIKYEFGEAEDDSRVVKCLTAGSWSPVVPSVDGAEIATTLAEPLIRNAAAGLLVDDASDG